MSWLSIIKLQMLQNPSETCLWSR